MKDIVKIKWLKDFPVLPQGITWGVPWTQGELQRNEPVTLTDSSGQKEPLQTWITAYWPDGSVKWTAHATSFSQKAQLNYHVSKGEPIKSEIPLLIKESKTIKPLIYNLNSTFKVA